MTLHKGTLPRGQATPLQKPWRGQPDKEPLLHGEDRHMGRAGQRVLLPLLRRPDRPSPAAAPESAPAAAGTLPSAGPTAPAHTRRVLKMSRPPGPVRGLSARRLLSPTHRQRLMPTAEEAANQGSRI